MVLLLLLGRVTSVLTVTLLRHICLESVLLGIEGDQRGYTKD